MKTIEIDCCCEETGAYWTDWIYEDDLDQARIDADSAGVSITVVGEVSWQQQLSRMENNC